jgi:hypothetical protein
MRKQVVQQNQPAPSPAIRLSPIVHQCQKPLMEQKNTYPTCLTFLIRFPKPSLRESRLLVQFCAIPEQSPASCFERKQTAPNPEPYLPELHQHWQKPMSPQKNLLPKPPIPHKKAQFCTNRTIPAQPPTDCSSQKQTDSSPERRFSPFCAQFVFPFVQTKNPLPNLPKLS